MAEENHTHQEHSAAQHRHEQSDTEFKPIFIFIVSLAVLILLSMLAMSWLFDYFAAQQTARQQPPSPLFDTRQVPPEPRLQTSPAQDLEVLKEREADLLSSYRWVDRESKVFRIPVERAMEILVERGLPHRGDSGDVSKGKGSNP